METVQMPSADAVFKSRLVSYLKELPHGVLLDSHTGPVPVTGIRYRYLAAGGCVDSLSSGSLSELEVFLEKQRRAGNWVFGFLTYDVKNELESLHSAHPDHTGTPTFHFFVPEWVIAAGDNDIRVSARHTSPALLLKEIGSRPDEPDAKGDEQYEISHSTGREHYFKAFDAIQRHLRRGDIYEVNYCRQLVARATHPDPVRLFQKLAAQTRAPFSGYYKTGPWHLVCASPERFMTRRGDRLISQPMKGTASRAAGPEADAELKVRLAQSEKERAENVMIVDLVRNDLSRVARRGSVRVDELCGIYTFPNVHQMISTISCTLKEHATFTDIVRALFPMGSMTGAPKISAMKIIEEQEDFRRSLFSGTMGYIDPSGDFDFNVVIRSILLNTDTGIATVAAGGAITALSDPEKEFNETILKMKPQLEALGINQAAWQAIGTHAERI